MGIHKFFYLFEPFWLVFLMPFAAFILASAILSFLYTRKYTLKELSEFPLWIRVLVSFVASGFILLPLLAFSSLYAKYQDTNYVVIFIIKGYAKSVNSFFTFLGELVPNSWFYSSTSFEVLFSLASGVMYLSILFAPVLLIIMGGLLLVFKRYTWKEKLKIILVTFVMGILCTAFSISSALWLYDRLEEFNRKCSAISSAVSNFRSHVDDLCNKRPTLTECPKNEPDLRAFNSEKYDALETCTNSEYFFSEKYGQLWLVKKDHSQYSIWSSNKLTPPKSVPSYLYGAHEIKKLRQQYAE